MVPDWVPVVVVLLAIACANWTILVVKLARDHRRRLAHLAVCPWCSHDSHIG